VIMIYTGPTTAADKRTLMGSYDAWKQLTPRLDASLTRRIDQELMRNRDKPLIKIDFGVTEARTILDRARAAS
jgi:hypothetical protein